MWNNTRVTEILGIRYPIIQGPFGGRFSSVKLLSAVSNNGGLGSFGLNAYSHDEILEIDRQAKASTNFPYNLNLWVPLKNDSLTDYSGADHEKWKTEFSQVYEKLGLSTPERPSITKPDYEGQIEALLEARPPVASFIFSIPSEEILGDLRKSGTKTIVAITNVEEALLAEESSADIILATGCEAGGHRPSFVRPAENSLISTENLVTEVLQKVTKPVIAAGGISDGIQASKYLKLGASAVQMGTAFLACDESNASGHHKELLRSESSYETQLTNMFTGRLARAITNRFSEYFNLQRASKIAPYPLQSQLLSPIMKKLRDENMLDHLAHWAGIPSSALIEQNADTLLRKVVGQIVAEQNNIP